MLNKEWLITVDNENDPFPQVYRFVGDKVEVKRKLCNLVKNDRKKYLTFVEGTEKVNQLLDNKDCFIAQSVLRDELQKEYEITYIAKMLIDIKQI